MSKEKYTTFSVRLQHRDGHTIEGQIIIRDGFALSRFSDAGLAKELYDAEKSVGNKNISYNPKEGFVVQKYPGMPMARISEAIKAELKATGGQLVEIR